MSEQDGRQGQGPTPMDRLMRSLHEAFEAKDTERTRRTCRAMGPHVGTLKRSIEAGNAPGTVRITAGRKPGDGADVGATAEMDVEQGADVAGELQIPTDVIALCIEETMRQADAKGDAGTVARIAGWLVERPELGLVCTDLNPPTTWRPISTWRLATTHPEAAAAWDECAKTFMRDARLRRAVR